MSHIQACPVSWPEINFKDNEDTFRLLHMASQMLGKIKLTQTSGGNHWWNVTLLLTPSGLTTGLLHYRKLSFEIRMDLHDHIVHIETSDGGKKNIELRAMSVARFYDELFESLNDLGIHIKIWDVPVEVEDRTSFRKDTAERKYDQDLVENFIWVMNESEKVMEEVRAKFIGKVSPVHFFWGAFDLSVSFFSGKKAPEHPGAPNIGRSVVLEAYSHEVCSFGFWPGMGLGEAAYFSYVYPEPEGFRKYKIKPSEAEFNLQFNEFILKYADVERSGSDKMIRDFFTSSLDAAFELAGWDEGLRRKSG